MGTTYPQDDGPVIKVHGKDYLTKAGAVAQFRRDYPIEGNRGAINTTIIQQDPPCVKAEIMIDGRLVSSAHATITPKLNTLAKVEGGAIKRALDLAGYTVDNFEDDDREEAAIEQGKQRITERGPRRIDTSEPAAQTIEGGATSPVEGEIRTFPIVRVETTYGKNGVHYALITKDKEWIRAFSRDFGREWGYTDDQMEEWKQQGWAGNWKQPLPVNAIYKIDPVFGGSWRWIAKGGPEAKELS